MRVVNVCSLNALVSSFTRLVSATVATMPETHQSEAREAFESLPAMLASQKVDPSTSFHDALSHASVAVLCPEFGAIATRCVATIQECSALADHQGALLKQCKLGEAWTYTGLLQSFLLVPQGPVDPVEKIMLKLSNFTKEVMAAFLHYMDSLTNLLHTIRYLFIVTPD